MEIETNIVRRLLLELDRKLNAGFADIRAIIRGAHIELVIPAIETSFEPKDQKEDPQTEVYPPGNGDELPDTKGSTSVCHISSPFDPAMMDMFIYKQEIAVIVAQVVGNTHDMKPYNLCFAGPSKPIKSVQLPGDFSVLDVQTYEFAVYRYAQADVRTGVG